MYARWMLQFLVSLIRLTGLHPHPPLRVDPLGYSGYGALIGQGTGGEQRADGLVVADRGVGARGPARNSGRSGR